MQVSFLSACLLTTIGLSLYVLSVLALLFETPSVYFTHNNSFFTLFLIVGIIGVLVLLSIRAIIVPYAIKILYRVRTNAFLCIRIRLRMRWYTFELKCPAGPSTSFGRSVGR